jgi:hypothetical protein
MGVRRRLRNGDIDHAAHRVRSGWAGPLPRITSRTHGIERHWNIHVIVVFARALDVVEPEPVQQRRVWPKAAAAIWMERSP